MNKEDIVYRVAVDTNVSVATAERIISAFLDNITTALADGDSVMLRGFGNFKMKRREARIARNPHNDEVIEVPAKEIPSFKPGYRLMKEASRIESEES